MGKQAPHQAAAPAVKGRSRSNEPTVTISFRVPVEVQEAFREFAEEDNKERPWARTKPSTLYNQALGEFLAKYGVKIEGWN